MADMLRLLGRLLCLRASRQQAAAPASAAGAAATAPETTMQYQLQSPAHPLISALVNRPESWPAVLAQIEEMVAARDG